jgi:hypothetical protein
MGFNHSEIQNCEWFSLFLLEKLVEGTSKKPKTLRYALLAKCSFTLVNSAFASVASLDFGIFRNSIEFD